MSTGDSARGRGSKRGQGGRDRSGSIPREPSPLRQVQSSGMPPPGMLPPPTTPGSQRSPSKTTTPVPANTVGSPSGLSTGNIPTLSPSAAQAGPGTPTTTGADTPTRDASPSRIFDLPQGWLVDSPQWWSLKNPESASADTRVLLHNLDVLAVRVDQAVNMLFMLMGRNTGRTSKSFSKTAATAEPEAGASEQELKDRDLLVQLLQVSGLFDDLLRRFVKEKKGDQPLKHVSGKPARGEFNDFMSFLEDNIAEEVSRNEEAQARAAEEGEDDVTLDTPMADLHHMVDSLSDDAAFKWYIDRVKENTLHKLRGSIDYTGAKKKGAGKRNRTSASASPASAPRQSKKKRVNQSDDEAEEDSDEQMEEAEGGGEGDGEEGAS